ncbi:MAG: PAS domain S-box-containing protein [Ulvibacter sp.]|jgi:PAS domain S-box-containing protein
MNRLSYKESEKELNIFKKTVIKPSKDDQYRELFDSMTLMVGIIELIYNENDKAIDFYMRAINISITKVLGKTNEHLIDKKISSVFSVIEDDWFNHFANVDKTGRSHTFKKYGAAFDKYYLVTAWKVSKSRVGVSFIDITETEKPEIELKRRLEKERSKTERILKEKKIELNTAAAALDISNSELAFQNEEKEKRAAELVIAKREKAAIAKELRQFIDTANAPIFGIDSHGLVNEWNEISEKITGFKKGNVLGRDLLQTYIIEDYREAVKQVFADALKGKETTNFEFPLYTKDGELLMVLLNSSTRRDGTGKITGVLGVGRDITELLGCRNNLEMRVGKRTKILNIALEKEKKLNELKSRFVSTASHEFRTPLSAINFAAGSMKKYWCKMEPIMIEKKLEKIERQVLHMTKLLDDILIVGQAEVGEIRNHPLTLNLGNFISEIIEEVYESSGKSHEIVLIDKEVLISNDIYIDEKLGRNIFINLISNALKYSPKADQVFVELSSEKDYTIISVTDFGLGIPESEIEKIFMPFTRGENVDSIQGTGLGLSIVKEALVVMGGKIIVNSTLVNGTTFMVKIPKKQI